MKMDFEKVERINKEMLDKAISNLERNYDSESFQVFSKCIKNNYFICLAKEYEEEENYQYARRYSGTTSSRYYNNVNPPGRNSMNNSRMNYFKRETEMIKEVERLLDTNEEEDKEKILEQLEETFKDLKVMYPNFYETALRKVRKI